MALNLLLLLPQRRELVSDVVDDKEIRWWVLQDIPTTHPISTISNSLDAKTIPRQRGFHTVPTIPVLLKHRA